MSDEISRGARKLIWLSYGSLFALGLADNIKGPLYPEVRAQFLLGNVRGSLFFALASLMLIPGGYLGSFFIRRAGRLATLKLSLFLLSLSLSLIACLGDFNLILSAVVLSGAALGMLGVVQNVIVVESAYPEELSRWQSGLHSMYGLASLIAPQIVSVLYGVHPQWQLPFFFVSVLIFLFFLYSLKIPDRGHNFSQPESLQALAPFSNRQAYFFSFITAAYVASELLVSTRIAQYCREVVGYDLRAAAGLNTLYFICLFLGRVLFAFWQPRLSLKVQLIMSLVLSAGLCLAGVKFHPLALALSGLAMAPFYPMAMTMAGRLFQRNLSQVAGLMIAMSGVLVVLMHVSVGYLSDQYGVAFALRLGPLFSMIALMMLLLYPSLFKRKLP
jgi:MFS transporter, FHS family, glucose/mannose:H+ symporter